MKGMCRTPVYVCDLCILYIGLNILFFIWSSSECFFSLTTLELGTW